MPPPEPTPLLLLIDDSPYIHRLLAAKLRDEGLEILAALAASEGLEIARAQQPSLILLDLNMPEMHGIDALRLLKDSPRTMGIPVIVLSGNDNASEKVRAFELGAMDYVVKPFNVPELRARIGSALRITRLMRLLEHRAQIDGMTGLWNRAYFNDRLTTELSAASRSGKPLSLVMCDLDHFKRLNDTYGHPAGDDVLQTFAQLLTQELRGYDIASRYGGEEFALILPGADAKEAAQVCDRIRSTLGRRVWKRCGELRVTASFGVTDRPIPGEGGPGGWVEAADRALYAAKQSGRNRVRVFEGSDGGGERGEMRRAG